ncbi:hypothetical protein N9115_01040 [bacterium]|nr:hypothetical protein [bacterium]
MNTQKIGSLVALIAVVIIGSFIFGSAAAQQDVLFIGSSVAIAFVLTIFVALGRSTWIVIPIFSMWGGQVPALPLPFSVSNLAIIFAVGAWTLHLLTRKETFGWRFKRLDIAVGLVMFTVVLAFIRNPVGLKVFGNTELIGGRPYFEVLMALVAYVMLSSIKPNIQWFNRIPVINLVTAGLLAIGGGVAFFVPDVGMVLYHIYSGFMPNIATESMSTADAESVSVGRSAFLSPISLVIVYFLYAHRPPIQSALPTKPLGFAALLFAVACGLASGFRSLFGAHGACFFLASMVWSGFRGAFLALFLALVVVGLVSGSSYFVTYPDQIERSLSFLPGDWEQWVVQTGTDSTDWRVEMWEEALYGDGIKNKYLGDGFGVSRAEMEYYQTQTLLGQATPADSQRYYLLTGSLHSGPITAIRFVGALGLLIYLILAISVAVGFTKLWRLCIRRREKILVGFFALPALYHPFYFLLIFGSYDNDLPKLLISAGLLVLCRNLLSQIQREDENRENEEGPNSSEAFT